MILSRTIGSSQTRQAEVPSDPEGFDYERLSLRGLEVGNGRAPAAAVRGGVMEAADQRVAGKQALHAGALYSDASAVDQSYLAETFLVGGLEEGFHYRGDIARRKGVKVETVLDRNLDWKLGGRLVFVFFCGRLLGGSGAARITNRTRRQHDEGHHDQHDTEDP